MQSLIDLLKTLQTQITQNGERKALFVYTLIAIMLPVVGSRASQLYRTVTKLFKYNVTIRRFYGFMASPKLAWDKLWPIVWQKILPLNHTEGPILLSIDDSMVPKTGKNIFACGNHFDHAAKLNQSRYIWGQNIVKLSCLKNIHGRWASLPLNFRFYRLNKDVAKKNFQTRIDQAISMILSVLKVCRHRSVLLVCDNWFGNGSLYLPLKKELGEQFHLLSRLRSNSVLYDQPTLPKKRKRGAPKKYGKRRGNVAALARRHKRNAKTYQVELYGKSREVRAYTELLMSKSLKTQIRVVWIYSGRASWVAIFSTDITFTVAQIIEWYGARWKIEAGFKELKQELGSLSCQARTKHAVTNHLHFCMMAMSLLWFYVAQKSSKPSRRYSVINRKSFAFSDIRRLFAEEIEQEEFSEGLGIFTKLHKNKFISTMLQLVA
ncbi:IS701 family transposase [Zooshikella harenae]|uniref:Transposase n=1 Tax=Zooshikella harenae TaxID=2827238 RepID=A0ABS5ZKE9_9GAMM|nr:transposase [Zooshikella harenae]MBU2714373.1 transposase [Zooshikella harenae]